MTTGSAATRTPEENLDVRIGRRVALVGACALVLVVYVLHAALPATVISLPGPQKRLVSTFVPEGWAFFTKSPRSVSPQVYQHLAAGTWRDITAGPIAKASDAMGLDRMARSQGTELAMIFRLVPENAWLDCQQQPTDCLSQVSAALTVPNVSNHHSICGEVGLVAQEVLPWAWRDTPAVMPSKVVRVRVTC